MSGQTFGRYNLQWNQNHGRWWFYLQETLHVLQQVEAAVAAVVLKRNSAVRVLHLICTEVPRRAAANLPLWLQVAWREKFMLCKIYIKIHRRSCCRQTREVLWLTPVRVWRLAREENVWGNPWREYKVCREERDESSNFFMKNNTHGE